MKTENQKQDKKNFASGFRSLSKNMFKNLIVTCVVLVVLGMVNKIFILHPEDNLSNALTVVNTSDMNKTIKQ